MTTLLIGYSGSRFGMTRFQIRAIHARMCWLGTVYDNDPGIDGIEGHHGDCLGGDAGFHVLATALGWRVIAHPGITTRWRAHCQADVIREPQPFRVRDRAIAWETGELMAAPKSPVPDLSSGTWTTIGFALEFGRPVTVFAPDGTVRPGTDFLSAFWRETWAVTR